jgi:hypothetical protein
MTEHNDRPIQCLDCDSTVRLVENERGTLVTRCDCDDKRRAVKVRQVKPEGWT